MKKTCNECSNEFETEDYRVKYCSDDCREEFRVGRVKGLERYSRYFIFYRDRFQCFYCGIKIYEYNDRFELDHLIAEKKGGKNTYYNLVTACRTCNSQKSSYDLSDDLLKEFQEEIKKRTELLLKDIKKEWVYRYKKHGTYAHIYGDKT